MKTVQERLKVRKLGKFNFKVEVMKLSADNNLTIDTFTSMTGQVTSDNLSLLTTPG